MLGWGMSEVMNQISFPYDFEESAYKGRFHIIAGDCIDLYLHPDTKILQQITVHGDYKGKFRNEIGIGTILSNLKTKIPYEVDKEDMECSIVLPDYKGIFINTANWGDGSTKTEKVTEIWHRLSYTKLSRIFLTNLGLT